MKIIFLHVLIFVTFNFTGKAFDPPQKATKLNILLIVADDMGYTDLGCFGSEISTPNIDLLASKGILFTRFHAAPLCAPTRSMILSGNDNHVAGLGSMFSVKGTPREGKPGYEHRLSDRIVTVAQLLMDAGYQTFMAGKWHLGSRPVDIPFTKGFQRSFSLLDGGANHIGNQSVFGGRPPQYREDSSTVQFPEGKFSTDVYTEKMLGYIKDAQKDKPFFAYLAYTAPHWPLQLPDKNLNTYKGKYNMGYDSLRMLRFKALKAKGIIPANSVLPPRLESIKPWNKLTAEEKKIESRKMELYAALVDNLDKHIGQVIQYLKDSKQLDNTIIVFMSDNGAAAEDFYNHPEFGPYIREHYDNSYANMGKPTSFVSYGPQWAQAGAAPFKLFKEYTTEGGVSTPLIVSGSLCERSHEIQSVSVNVTDLAPTFLEIAGVEYPELYNNKKMTPMAGQSFLPFIQGSSNKIHDENYVYGLEHYGECLLIKGNWKITNISDPFDERAFSLYKIDEDWGETNDLSKSKPQKMKDMMEEWERFKKRVGVIPLESGERVHLDVNR